MGSLYDLIQFPVINKFVLTLFFSPCPFSSTQESYLTEHDLLFIVNKFFIFAINRHVNKIYDALHDVFPEVITMGQAWCSKVNLGVREDEESVGG